MSKPEKSTTLPRFETGDEVRVKLGVTDPDFPDIPLGGWSGMIWEVDPADEGVTCLIEWGERNGSDEAPGHLG
jgi:hypothetical protein